MLTLSSDGAVQMPKRKKDDRATKKVAKKPSNVIHFFGRAYDSDNGRTIKGNFRREMFDQFVSIKDKHGRGELAELWQEKRKITSTQMLVLSEMYFQELSKFKGLKSRNFFIFGDVLSVGVGTTITMAKANFLKLIEKYPNQ